MKTLRYVFSGVILLSILLSSCVKETAIGGGEGQPVQITFRTGTRSGGAGTPDGDPEDRYINSLRVLGYRVSDGTLAFNEFLDEAIVAGAEKRIDVVTGRFTIVFIANEHEHAATSALLAGITTAANNTLLYLEGISFPQAAFSASKDIPMVRIKENVNIQGDKRLVDDGTSIDGVWEITMERLGVRVDLTLDLDGHTLDTDAGKVLSIKNVPNKVYLFQKNNYNEGTTTVTRPLSEDTDGDGNIIWRRIILPESMFFDKENAEKAVELSLWIDNQECTALIGLDTKNAIVEDRNYTLPRNTYLDITATANPQQQALDCSATITKWEELAQDIIFDGPYFLKVSEDILVIPALGGNVIFTAETNYNVTAQGYPAGIVCSTSDEWIDWTLSGEISKRTIKVEAEKNTSGGERTAKIYIQAGNMVKVINVTQPEVVPEIPEEIPGSGTAISAFTYVGAFWRAEQTGERLIRIPVNSGSAGKWAVQVLEYGDFAQGDIVFSTSPSNDINIGWRSDVTPNESLVADMNDPTMDALYQVAGNSTSISGSAEADSYIFFRIGLKSKWIATDTKPVRYAVIVVSYKDNMQFQKIFLRQGEGADYLMLQADASTGTWESAARPLAGRFSPYNLTSPEYKYNRSTQDYELAGIMESPAEDYFTNYPSQAGALYQFAPNYGIYAFHPSIPQMNNSSVWEIDSKSQYWDAIKNTIETCPYGYHRMSNGSTSILVSSITPATSEVSQSLFSQTGSDKNTAWGYYADGFFDRRATGKQTSRNSEWIDDNTAVATNTSGVAYIGQLFYNPNNNASLFFPATGFRWPSGANAGLMDTDAGFYWTSTGTSGSGGWFLWIYRGASPSTSTSRSYGYAIRCVKDTDGNP